MCVIEFSGPGGNLRSPINTVIICTNCSLLAKFVIVKYKTTTVNILATGYVSSGRHFGVQIWLGKLKPTLAKILKANFVNVFLINSVTRMRRRGSVLMSLKPKSEIQLDRIFPL